MEGINQQSIKWRDKRLYSGYTVNFDHVNLCKAWDCKQYVNFGEMEHCQIITRPW